MSDILDRPITLCLNSGWLPIRTGTVREAILAMNSASGDKTAYVGLDIQYMQNEDGSFDFSEPLAMIPTKWEDWIKLPIRPFDEVIHSARFAIRAPTVVIAVNYAKMPQKRFRVSKRTLYERDKGKCCYTGKELTFREATIEHIISKDEWKRSGRAGSPDNWQNVAICDPKINHAKSNKPLSETGLKLKIKPKEPMPIPMAALITEARNRDWSWFLMKEKK